MKKTIENIDKNLKIENSFLVDDLILYDIRNEPFDIYGLYNPKYEQVFKRLPDDVARSTSDGVESLAKNTAGGRVRFTTDSSYIAIKTIMPSITRLSHMTLAGTSGFDLFIDQGGKGTYKGTFMPPYDMTEGYESIIHFPNRETRSLTIHFPLYNDVSKLYVGLQADAHLGHGAEYAYSKPILFYGSSITQGGCASRPGNCYQNIITSKLNYDHINLGFSGSAKAEDTIVEYMASLDFSIFVCDYDHNAPSVEHLKATHEKMFLKIRGIHKSTPIILISRPDFDKDVDQNIIRRDVIYKTYMNARSLGDQNVYFIDGERLFMNSNRDACTVDGCHPNDAGFVRIAEVVADTIDCILRKRKNNDSN